MNKILQITVAALLFSVFAFNVTAAEVRSGISTRETFVGLPVTFQVQIANATKYDPPTMPDIPGLRIESVGQPSRSTQTTIINGSMSSRSSVTYSFAVTPLAPGNYRIPPISVQADSETLETRPFEFVASKSETGDLLFVEVEGKEKQIYVGQALDLQLKIWVRPYRDKEHGITLSEGDMWQLIAERTSWGPFQERIEQFVANNQRPVGTEVLRKDREGVDHSYYLYEIDATIYPKKPGRVDANDVQVIALYPTAIGQSQNPFGGMFEEFGFPGQRSPFGRSLEIESVRPIVAEASVEPIEVQEIPIADRPADYRGAVGKYQIVTGAEPTDVKAGDPIKLIMGIAGTGPMDLVQAPPLAELPSLTKNFKVPNEPLAGYVDGARKVFSTTIRPRSAGTTEIPSIPFTYFDPQVGKFVTAQSAPISIHVAPADTLALDAVVGRSTVDASTNDSTKSVAATGGPVLTNYSGDDLLTNQSPAAGMSRTIWLAIISPPVVVLGMLLARSRAGVALVASGFRSAGRKCQAEVEAATRSAEIGNALRRFLPRHAGLATTADTTAIVGALRAAGQRNSAVRCERLLEQCDEHGVAGFSSVLSLHELKQLALQLIQDIEAESSRPRPQASPATRTARRFRATTAMAFALLMTVSSGATYAAEPLTATQQQTLLTEATASYEAARAVAGADSADAKEAFAAAAEKYQSLIDSAVTNNRMYVNLGNAYLESGATGRAIANYRRALALDPTDHVARANLTYAEGSLKLAGESAASIDSSITAKIVAGNNFVNQFVRPHTVLVVGLVSWLTFWIALGMRLAEILFPWKSVALAAILLSAITVTSYCLTCQSLAQPTAIVVSSATLQSGDGAQFPTVSGTPLAEGQSVDFLRHRGEWSQVRTAIGETGWLPSTALETL